MNVVESGEPVSAICENGLSQIIWDVTYACPLRCVHCYSESGRRPSRQLDRDGLSRVADALIAARPRGIVLAGGEPLVVPGILEIVDRIGAAGITPILYTSGWSLATATVERLAAANARVAMSVDGATAQTHDRIRGRAGSFQRALRSLHLLDHIADDRPSFRFGIDYTVLRGNIDELAAFCADIAPRFQYLSHLSFGAAIPSGLASQGEFAEAELLSDSQTRWLMNPENIRNLRSKAPSTVTVTVTDNRYLQMRPDWIAAGDVSSALQVEPDGAVRAMPMYEGTVGNVLTEPIEVLWDRAVARWSDPFVTRTLADADTTRAWARATRLIDEHFGSEQVRDRIRRRPGYEAPGGHSSQQRTV